MIFKNGVATFTLKHGQEKVATDIPAETSYTVNETNNEGYNVTSKGEKGTIEEGKETKASFINEKDRTQSGILPYAGEKLLPLGIIASMTSAFIYWRKLRILKF